MAATTLVVRVVRTVDEAEGIRSFELEANGGTTLPPFTAGAHVDVQVPGGPVRPYSLYSDPAEPGRWRIAVLRESASRGGSAGMHERVRAGDLLTIGAPRNLFPLAGDARRHLLLAGGIGITPLLAMAQVLAREGADFALHYATRSRERTAFAAELRASPFADRVHFHVDDGEPAQRLDLPALLAAPEAGRHVYVCGPQGLLDAALATARAKGWPEGQLHWEAFAATPVDAAGERDFEVQIGEGGRVVRVPAGTSVVKALAAAGIEVPTSCEQGVCGTCLTRVIDGEPDHRDQYLTPEEQAACDQFLPCCSRAKSARLVLEL